MKKIDIIVPCYNEEESLPHFYDTIIKVAQAMDGFGFDYIFVNDGSSDNTLDVIKELAERDSAVKYISFSRNFGKEAAIYAGIVNASGDIVILLDADLQHPPELIPDMVKAVTEEGYGAAGAKRRTGFFSRGFTWLNNKISNTKLQRGATDYMCMSRQFVDAVLKLSETQRFSKGLFAWVGFNVKWFDYEQGEREYGKTTWNFHKLFNYATDGLTAFSLAPLKIVTIVGAIVFVLALIYIIITLIKTLIYGVEVPGYVTTLVTVLFMGGIIMLAIGVLGVYVGSIYMETKKRPVYIPQESNIEDPDKDNKVG